MPRPKKIMPTSDFTGRIYGLWTTNKHLFPDGTWMLDGSGNIIYSDLLGVMKAQANRLKQDGMAVKVCIIGDDGSPEDLV